MLQGYVMKTIRNSLLIVVVMLTAPVAMAVEFSYTGFASLVAGKVTSGSPGNPGGTLGAGAVPSVDPLIDNGHCPCAMGNWPNVGIYDQQWTIRPETRAGLQGTLKFDEDLSMIGQATARLTPHRNGDVTPDWLYVSYNLNSAWTVQAGRKRLPIYNYSDFMDIGYSYPWIHPPQDLYGWQIDHYNGANLMYRDTVEGIGVTWNIWTGAERDRNNEMLNQLYYHGKIDENWYNMLGTYVDLSRDWWQVRVIYMNNEVTRRLNGAEIHSADKQHFTGFALNLDPGQWVIRSEYNQFIRPDDKDYYYASLVGVGYRIGDWLPMLTYSQFREDFQPSPNDTDEIHHTRSASLRWDFRPGMALKAEYDDFVDHSHWPFLGNTKLVTLGLDTVF